MKPLTLTAWWFALLAALVALALLLPSPDRGVDDMPVTPATDGPPVIWDIRDRGEGM